MHPTDQNPPVSAAETSAGAAQLPLTQLLPTTVELPGDGPRLREALRLRYGAVDDGRVRLTLVTSLNGVLVGHDGTSGALSNPVDREVLRAVRATADVVLLGARTVRAERVAGPSSPPLAVLSASGDLRGATLPEGHRVLLVTPPGGVPNAPDGVRASHVVVPELDRGLDVAAVIRELRARGFGRVVCEGGAQLASAALAQGVVSECCLTVVDRLVPSVPGSVLTVPVGVSLTPTLLIRDDTHGATYGRWAVTPPPSPIPS